MTLAEIMALSEGAFQQLFRNCLRRLWGNATSYAKGNYLARIKLGETKVFPNRTKVHNSDRIRARDFLKDKDAQWRAKALGGEKLRITRTR